MPRSRPGRVRTKNTNRRAPLSLSSMAPEDYNVRPGETMSIACPDCRTWRRIMGDTVLKIREHCISDKRAEGETHALCPGSDQLVIVDIDVRRWQATQNRLLRDAMPQDNRRAAQQFYKPLAAPAVPVHRLAARERTSLAHLFALLEQARHVLRAHRTACTGCLGGGRCATGRDLEIRVRETQATCTLAREQQTRAERAVAQRARTARARQERSRAEVLNQAHQTDQLRRTVPQGALPTDGPEVPLAHLAPRQVAAQPEVGQLQCEHCGATESSLTDAVAAGWHRITRRPHCGRCAQRFPAWTRTSL
ncbi:hypothetical protein OHT61_32240 (plasmid) [Streptomyces sp. NBC_00178]|uniref:hypothetical protein n=1 Tax=Streptomyces sp. NBC_00178 TaxID=2975672 RepID=UPI002E29AF85|nr:hypothetical protein [Streptomyces sp. NBC_00178]